MTDSRQKRIQSFAFVLSACAAVCFAYHFIPVINMNSVSHVNLSNMNNRINPNNAEVESLIRLPDIGYSRAEAIIQYRDMYIKNNSNKRAFKTSDDLQNIKGIGPKTIQNMSQWLKFD